MSPRVCPACKGRATKIVSLSDGTYTCQQCGHRYDPLQEAPMGLVLTFYALVDARGHLFDCGAGPGRATLFTSPEDIEPTRRMIARLDPKVRIIPVRVTEEQS